MKFLQTTIGFIMGTKKAGAVKKQLVVTGKISKARVAQTTLVRSGFIPVWLVFPTLTWRRNRVVRQQSAKKARELLLRKASPFTV